MTPRYLKILHLLHPGGPVSICLGKKFKTSQNAHEHKKQKFKFAKLFKNSGYFLSFN